MILVCSHLFFLSAASFTVATGSCPLTLGEGRAVPLWAVEAKNTPLHEAAGLSKVVARRRLVWQSNRLYRCPAVCALCCQERARVQRIVPGRSSASLSWNNWVVTPWREQQWICECCCKRKPMDFELNLVKLCAVVCYSKLSSSFVPDLTPSSFPAKNKNRVFSSFSPVPCL